MANENNGSNVILTAFDKLFRDDAKVNAQSENISAEMLKEFFDYQGPEAAFDKVWIASFYKMESKTKGETLRNLMAKLSPNEFEAWLLDSELDEKSATDKKTQAAFATRKADAKKKIKAVENRIRRVIEALAALRFSPVPVKKVTVQKGKLLVYTLVVDEATGEADENMVEKAEFSMAELIKGGIAALTKEQLKTKIEPRPGSNEKALVETVAKLSETDVIGKTYANLAKSLAAQGKRDAYTGETADNMMALVAEVLRHFYSNEDGTELDVPMILDWLENVEAKVFASETEAKEEKAA